jgi:PAS domain S-box-containing protein
MYGYSAEEMIGQSFSRLIPSENAQEVANILAMIRGDRRVVHYETVWVTKDGCALPVLVTVSPVYDAKGIVIGASSISRDMTEEKKAEQKFRALLESAPDAMVIYNGAGIIVMVNSQTEKLFNYHRDEMLGQFVEFLVPSRFHAKHSTLRDGFFTDLRARPMTARVELYARRKDGSEFTAEISLSPIETEEGALAAASIRDVTEQKQTLRKLIEANRENRRLAEVNEMMVAEDLERAAEVQRGLLPKQFVNLPGYQVAGACLPAQAVGGDFYDWYPVAEGAAFTLADVMGKGIGAAIFAATVRAVLRSGSRHEGISLVVEDAAETLGSDLDEAGVFVTLFHARLNVETGVLQYIDAGHGRTDRLATTNFPLGSGINESWTEKTVTLDHGDTLIAVSDGVLDIFDGTLASLDEVAKVARGSQSAQAVVDTFVEIAKGACAADDVSLLVVRRSE